MTSHLEYLMVHWRTLDTAIIHGGDNESNRIFVEWVMSRWINNTTVNEKYYLFYWNNASNYGDHHTRMLEH